MIKKIGIKAMGIILLFIISFIGTIHFLNYKEFKISNEEFLRYLINDTYIYSDVESKSLSYYIVKYILKIDLSNPSTLFKNHYSSLVSTASDEIESRPASEYVSDPYPEKEMTDPLVYIYNTHQLEGYSDSNILEYGVKPNVLMVSYVLREKLYQNGINSIVEDNNINEFLITNNWNYASSYKVTRILMEDKYSNYPSLNYFIDLHRDSVNKKISTVSIDGKNYAKILFIVGLENKDYEKNKAVTSKINEMLKERYPGISRGIYEKKGPGVNGVYNQDFHPNTILIEMGGEENTIDEVLNTTLAVSSVLTDYIKEDMKINEK